MLFSHLFSITISGCFNTDIPLPLPVIMSYLVLPVLLFLYLLHQLGIIIFFPIAAAFVSESPQSYFSIKILISICSAMYFCNAIILHLSTLKFIYRSFLYYWFTPYILYNLGFRCYGGTFQVLSCGLGDALPF